MDDNEAARFRALGIDPSDLEELGINSLEALMHYPLRVKRGGWARRCW